MGCAIGAVLGALLWLSVAALILVPVPWGLGITAATLFIGARILSRPDRLE